MSEVQETVKPDQTPAPAPSNKMGMLTGLLGVTTIAFMASTIYLAVDRNDSSPAPAPSASLTTPQTSADTQFALTFDPPVGDNVCAGTKPVDNDYFDNIECVVNGVVQALEQSGANVTVGYKGEIAALEGGREPITVPYFEAGLCPVNVHWHLGAEHLSVGEFDENGSGPSEIANRRKLAGKEREGFQCSLYDDQDTKFTKEFDWQHCIDMEVGQTYEVHWPHSAAGACGTPNQYQTPFYDGVFCNGGIISLDPLNTYQKIGVQAQVFTIVNDEEYYYPDLMRGMIVDAEKGTSVTKYTGSTTGTSRNNTICSRYTPITWQVDRVCHMVSASTFDKMCADMKAQRDDMSDDLYAHGSRELVADSLAADNHQNRNLRSGFLF